MVDGPQAADTLVTEENIHEVKVALTGRFNTVDDYWSYSAFFILPPHKLSPGLNRKHAEIFCKNVLRQRNLKMYDKPQLSWWLLSEIEKEFLAKQAEIAALNSSKSSPPMSPPAKDKEEVKQEEGFPSSTKPATNAKEQPVQVPADAFVSQLAAL